MLRGLEAPGLSLARVPGEGKGAQSGVKLGDNACFNFFGDPLILGWK